MGILDAPGRSTPTLDEVAKREGRFWTATYSDQGLDATSWTYAGAGKSLVSTWGSFNVGQAVLVDQIILGSNRTVLFNCYLSTAKADLGGASILYTPVQAMCGVGSVSIAPHNMVMRHSMEATSSIYLRGYYDATLTGFAYSTQVIGRAISDDFNLSAAQPILFLGDSIWNGNCSTKELLIPWMIRQYYADKGQSVRMNNQSLSSTTSTHHEIARSRGRYDYDRVGAIFYSLGANDATLGTTVGTYRANIDALIAWKQARYPAAKLVIFGSTPLENNTAETALALLRAQAAASVTAAADSKVLYCSLASIFDRTVTANYQSSDTPGSRVHPSDAGITTEWTGTIKPWLDANLPLI